MLVPTNSNAFHIAPYSGPLSRSVELNETGLVFGLGTRLAPMAKSGKLAVEPERLLALLSVAARRPVSTDVIRHVEAAAGYWQRGDKALANIRLMFAGLPRLHDAVDAQRLQLADSLLDAGLTPRSLMTELDLDPACLDLAKAGYNPNQARVPSGNGVQSGRWEEIWTDIKDWFEQPVPVYDQDTGLEVGTQSRGRAIATNPVTVGVAATAALLGGEAVAGTAVVESGFSYAEMRLINEAKSIVSSSQMADLAAAHANGESALANIGGRFIQYEPGLPASGMTLFGENGFVMGPEAFSSDMEHSQTVLHELYRLNFSNSAGGVSADLAAHETTAAANFAARATRLLP